MLVGLISAAIVAGATSAPAPDVEQARHYYNEGRQAYDAERYAEALNAFKRAYTHRPAPALLFNIGQCHRQLGDRQSALTFYERYLSEVPDAPNREVVQELIAELKAEISTAAAPTDAPEVPGLPQQEASAADSLDTPAPSPDPQPSEEPLLSRWWLWAAVGGAAAAVVAGTVVTLALVLPGEERTVLPYGSLGTLDRR